MYRKQRVKKAVGRFKTMRENKLTKKEVDNLYSDITNMTYEHKRELEKLADEVYQLVNDSQYIQAYDASGPYYQYLRSILGSINRAKTDLQQNIQSFEKSMTSALSDLKSAIKMKD